MPPAGQVPGVDSAASADVSESPSRGARRSILIGSAFAVACVATTWAARDFPLSSRAPMLFALTFALVSLGYGGFWSSVITLFPGVAAAAWWLIDPLGSFAVSDPLDRMRLSVSSALFIAIGAYLSVVRVDRGRLLERERAHRESEERYRNLIEQASDAIFVSDDDGRILIVNECACTMLGYSRDELLAKNIRQVISAESLAARPLRVLELRTSPLVHAEREMVRKDGARIIVDVTARRVSDGRTQAITRDVTERRRVEDHMRRLEAKLQHTQRLEAVGRLAAGIAHDFNNALTVIVMNAELLREGLAGDTAPQRAQEILDAGAHAASITRQLLAFSRKQLMAFRDLDPNEILREFEPILRRLTGSGPKLVVRLESPAGRVWADRTQLEQVLLNLVMNAKDAVGGNGSIEVILNRATTTREDDGAVDEPAGDHVVLTVRDDGPGMDAETQAKMFEPFFTTKPEGSGTGLGLASVFGIVRQSGGFIRVESAPGRGTAVRVFLPERKTPAEPGVTDTRPPAAAGKTILLVEDEEGMRRIVVRLLEDFGYSVVQAANREDALRLALAAEWAPSLLVIDAGMPGFRDAGLADALGARWAQLPVLYLTEFVPTPVAPAAGGGARRVFLRKPFATEQFIEAVTGLLSSTGDEAGRKA